MIYRILITGSRAWADTPTIVEALMAVPLLPGARPILVHGGAAGADSIANRVARRLGWERIVYRAEWRPGGVYNPQAGLLRNRQMVEAGAELCLAFILNGSRGASHCANLAEEAGIPTRRYEL